MSKSTKRKHVVKELLSNEFTLPTESQMIVQVKEGRGNNLHSVFNEDGSEFLVSMPSKFRKNVWVKRGDYLLVDVIPEGDKVRGEISTILDAAYVKYLKKNEMWPEAFDLNKSHNLPDTPPNNRRTFDEFTNSSSDSDSN